MDGRETQTKPIQYLSPSGYSICVTCGEVVKTKYAKPVDMISHLWVGPSEQRKKTKHVRSWRSFGIWFDSHRHFQIVCKNCYRSMCNALKEKENRTGKLKVACSLKQRFVQLRFKRTIPSD